MVSVERQERLLIVPMEDVRRNEDSSTHTRPNDNVYYGYTGDGLQ